MKRITILTTLILSIFLYTYALAIISLSTNDWVPIQGLKTLHENILLYKEKAS